MAQKKLDTYLQLPKVYYAEILLGKKSDSGDLDGTIIERTPVREPLHDRDIEQALDQLRGTHTYSVPVYSAIKVDGKPLYWYARKGITPPRIPVKEMTVTEVSLLDSYASDAYWIIKVRFAVSRGTYIRVLAEAVGAALGYPALLANLRRTQIGPYNIAHAQHIEEIWYTQDITRISNTHHMIHTQWENLTINIKATDIELTDPIRDYIENKVTRLGKFLQSQGGDIFVYFEIAETAHRNNEETYRADCKVVLRGKDFYASATGPDYMKAIDEVKEKLYHTIHQSKGKEASLFLKGARALKKLFRFNNQDS
ncbi:MAG: ribosome-associated translation inhibitor RaiA [Candidatus Pacebacteria bacterium]|nr:ribosome-associated translation inhibitor RaiA [Candidatus Paceibacterota bacterium]MCD8528300.1 ribosome-associated translation inhibitor RaiA [Candidatus Paceibacterota bacterium]